MALTERSRHRLYEALGPIIDDEQAVQEMLSYFPARDVEEPVTKDFLRAELNAQIGALRGEMHTEVGTLRAEMHAMDSALRDEIGTLRSEMHAEIGALRSEMHAMDSALREEIGSLRTEVERMVRTLQTWVVGTGISLAGLIVALSRIG